MKTLLYGSGAVGLGIAASLLDRDWKVDIIASGDTKKALEEGGINRVGLFKEIHIPSGNFHVYEKLSDIRELDYDYILLCVKANSNQEVALELSNRNKELKGKLVIFQNGWGNDEAYLKYFDMRQVFSARVITGFARPERNTSQITVHASPILIGSLYSESYEPVVPLAAAIDSGGIPCKVTMEVGKALWAKMLYNCTLNPLGAVLNVSYGRLTECENSVQIMSHMIEEIFKIMNAAGYETYWKAAEDYKRVFFNELIPPTYNHRSSTLQDIERKIRTEIDTLNGSIVKLGRKYNIPVPYNEMIYNLIKAMEFNF